MSKILNARNFCSVCTTMMQYIFHCAALGILNGITFVAFQKQSKEMLTTRTNVVVHPCGDVTFALIYLCIRPGHVETRYIFFFG